jgi:hypothetical protein
MQGPGRAIHAGPGIPVPIAGLHSLNATDNLGSCVSNIFEAFYLRIAVSKLIETLLYD